MALVSPSRRLKVLTVCVTGTEVEGIGLDI